MLETELSDLFARQAASRQPLAAITSQQVIRQGRSRLRIRRAGAIAAPLISAAVAAAVVVGVALPGALPARPGHLRSVPPTYRAAPKDFDPARLYPAFGWLPAGMQLITGSTGTISQELGAGPPGGLLAWYLIVQAGGQCSISDRKLRCKGESAQDAVPLTTQLPDINGLPAYLTVGGSQGTLVFEYAHGGWAELTESFQDGRAGLTFRADAVRVAEHVAFGTSLRSVVFPVQLTGLRGWRLRYAYLPPAPQGPPRAAGVLVFTTVAAADTPGAGILDNYPVLTVTSAASGGICSAAAPQTGSQSTTSVIAGHAVTIARGTVASPPSSGSGDGHGSAFQELCAADADGLTIHVVVDGNQPVIDVTQLFAHLRLLGPDPANWTTKPVA